MRSMFIKKNYNKLKLIGFKRTKEFVKNKLFFSFYFYLNKRRAKQKLSLGLQPNYSWPEISQALDFDNNFEKFWLNFLDKKEKNNFSKNILNKLINDYNFDQNYILSRANKALDNYIYLGPELINFTHANFIKRESWHKDFSGFNFSYNKFYKEIKIKINLENNIGPDIRTLWEFNRFQNTFFLGIAYKIENKNIYSQKFFEDTLDWIDNNPYLYGPNWVCPMEVGIRSVNLVLGFMFFKNTQFVFKPKDKITDGHEFWQKFICSLYDHMIFLERNWEIYDTRTNNHYLSDLLGYYYLLNFFETLGAKDINNKILWCKKEFLKELDKQILPDGSSYEGSTAYHVLVAEIVYYFKILAHKNSLTPDSDYLIKLEQKFKSICEFASFFYLDSGELITIGDNDSGKIVAGLPKKFLQPRSSRVKFRRNLVSREGGVVTKHFKNFGISIFKSKKLHVTLRHHAYNKLQPSGHFHNDFLSLTLAINNVPIIIDPGSYVYTASSYWRNYFRSAQVHNGFYIDGVEPIRVDNNLFGLEIPDKQLERPVGQMLLESSHELYKNLGLKATRKINLEGLDTLELPNSIVITDSWEQVGQGVLENFNSVWNLTLHPEIKAIKQGDEILGVGNIKLARISSDDLDFELVYGWASLNYGQKVQTSKLVAKKPLKLGNYTWKIDIKQL